MRNYRAGSTQEPILYLDFDGVLHHYDVYLDSENRAVLRGMGVLFEYAGRLEAALAPYPHVQIVLSTSWVRVKGFDFSRKRLPVGLRERIIGATWHSAFDRDPPFAHWWKHEASRYEQIARDVARRSPIDWIALDDDLRGWPHEERAHLVACDPQFGLSDPCSRLSLETKLQRFAVKSDRVWGPFTASGI